MSYGAFPIITQDYSIVSCKIQCKAGCEHGITGVYLSDFIIIIVIRDTYKALGSAPF